MLIPSAAQDLQRKLNESAASTGLSRVVPVPGLGYFAQPAPGTGGTSSVASVEDRCACSEPPSAEPSDEFTASGAGGPPPSPGMKGNRDGRPTSENRPSRPPGLSGEQIAVFECVVEKEKKDILVIAGPGSGKTSTLISCIVGAVQGGTPAGKIVAISFTNNSAAELKVRLCKAAIAQPSLHRVHVSTFHAWVGQLASARVDPWTYPPVGLKTASLAVALHLRNPDTPEHVFTKAAVAAAERHFEGCETFEAMEKRNFNKIAAEGKNRTGFNNLVEAATALEADMKGCQLGTFGTLMKSGVSLAAKLKQGDIEWLFIDEAQDLNAPQADFVAALQKKTGCRVFAIADDDQGIYKFRGASSRFLREFGARTTTKTFELTRNFRSTEQIVKACVQWITPNWTELRNPVKKLKSTRNGLPVVILAAGGWEGADKRGQHAKIIFDACIKSKLIQAYGEIAALGFSPSNPGFDLQKSAMQFQSLADRPLPPEVLETWLALCRDSKATGNWHHRLWKEFLVKVTYQQRQSNDPLLGHPGLDDLYAALEAIRRLQPTCPSHAAASIFAGINGDRTKGGEKFLFLGDRPEVNYRSDRVNYISLHSSKGMEFPVVWVTGGGYAFEIRDMDKKQGQPGVLGELGSWAEKVAEAIAKAATGKSPPDLDQMIEMAAQLENRRLLYVGMSRASDLLLISAPTGSGKSKKADGAFKAALADALYGLDHKIIRTDNEAHEFAATIRASHRNPTWHPPHRYRVESFTSLTRQSGENREVEIPSEREYPLPQSEDAMIGDLFHRIMHLLCMEPGLIQARLAHSSTNADLIARVTTATGLNKLDGLLNSYFSDPENRWELLQAGKCKSEVPFSFVSMDKASQEDFLIKGFLDLVRFNGDGNPDLILDYKTGGTPEEGSDEEKLHIEQLRIYREALCATYSLGPAQITVADYYVSDQNCVLR